MTSRSTSLRIWVLWFQPVLLGFGIVRQLDQLAARPQFAGSGLVDDLLQCGLELGYGFALPVFIDHDLFAQCFDQHRGNV